MSEQPAVEVEVVAWALGTIRDGFLLLSMGPREDAVWLALHHITAVSVVPGQEGCFVYAADQRAWHTTLSPETVRRSVAWGIDQQRRLGAIRT